MTTQVAPLTPQNGKYGHAARAKWATVVLDTTTGRYIGRVYIPDGKRRVSDVLCDNRPFLSVSEATQGDDGPPIHFIAINKTAILTVQIIDEGVADVIPIHGRA